jgi:hypothetical protein
VRGGDTQQRRAVEDCTRDGAQLRFADLVTRRLVTAPLANQPGTTYPSTS